MDLNLSSRDIVALGEPTHQEPAFARARNEIFKTWGFRSIALESDRAAALAVDDFVREGKGTLDEAMRDGFSHGLGDRAPNRELVAWMHEHNATLPPQERLSFHGFDAATENMNAPSPRRHLEHARDYLGLDLDIAALAGDDERWHRTEAILDPAQSPGATAEAQRLRVIADDMHVLLYTRATADRDWWKADAHLTTGLGLLRYHEHAARPSEGMNGRVSRLLGVRDALMARNLLDIRVAETGRGPTLVFAHNLHLQRRSSAWDLQNMQLRWSGAGAIVAALLGDRYAVVAGSLGRSAALGLADPAPDTYEAALRPGLTATSDIAPARTRTDTKPEQGYFPLDTATIDGTDAVLHI